MGSARISRIELPVNMQGFYFTTLLSASFSRSSSLAVNSSACLSAARRFSQVVSEGGAEWRVVPASVTQLPVMVQFGWGEAADEPAREDARPTEIATVPLPNHRKHSYRLKLIIITRISKIQRTMATVSHSFFLFPPCRGCFFRRRFTG